MRALKVLVVVMGVLIVAGTVTLVVLIVQRASGSGSGAGSHVDLALGQPQGTRIAGIAGAEGSHGAALAIWVQRPDGTEAILLVDLQRRRLVGEIRPGPAGGSTAGVPSR